MKLVSGEIQTCQTGDLAVTLWWDRHVVSMLSTNVLPETEIHAVQQTNIRGRMKRVVPDVAKKKPEVVSVYNCGMHSIDLDNQYHSYYTPTTTSKKFEPKHSVSKQKFREILGSRNSQLGAFYQKEISIPHYNNNNWSIETLVLIWIYVLAPGFLSPQSINTLKTLKQQNTAAQQQTFEQLSLKMIKSMIVPCGEIFFALSWVRNTGEKLKLFHNRFIRLINSQPFWIGSWQLPVHY